MTGIQEAFTDAAAHASGRVRRADPSLPVTGGPAGNAQLTAWTGLALLVLSLAEVVTLINVRGLISWHVVIGALLVPPALTKTLSTSWRIVRYYAGSPTYHAAGPPPLLLRLLGPLVVGSTFAVLATGLTLVALGQRAALAPFVTVLGHDVSWLTLHQISFIGWATVTGLHVLARFVPALRLSSISASVQHAGLGMRVVASLATVTTAVVLAYLLVGTAGSWSSEFAR